MLNYEVNLHVQGEVENRSTRFAANNPAQAFDGALYVLFGKYELEAMRSSIDHVEISLADDRPEWLKTALGQLKQKLERARLNDSHNTDTSWYNGAASAYTTALNLLNTLWEQEGRPDTPSPQEKG